MDLPNHPAVRLGLWLKAARQAKGLVKRQFAGEIMLTPAEYTEVELGVVHWLKDRQQKAIISALDLTGKELTQFKAMVAEAAAMRPLSFSNMFTREELEPIRCRRTDDSVFEPSEFEKELILNAVFAEIP